MRYVTFGLALVTLAAGRLGAQAPAYEKPAPGLDDATIVAILEQANTAEIELAELAAKMGQSTEVRDLGRSFGLAHTQARQKARDLAVKIGVIPTPPMDNMMLKTHGASITKLKELKGAEFDVALVAREIEHHSAMLETVDKKLLPAARNAELKALLEELKPSLQAHLDQARALEKRLALGQ